MMTSNMKAAVIATFCSFWVFAQAALPCNIDNCKIEDNCRCSSASNPVTDPADPAPQLIAITVSELIEPIVYEDYLKPLFFDRTNSDGGLIGLTFYVPHEYTDYTLVQDLYVRGYEIGVYYNMNATETYWRAASQQDLAEEFVGQKAIISTLADIPAEAITGARTLHLQGDVTINAYVAADLKYDNSWRTPSTNRLLPYSLDYASTQQCTFGMQCPTESHSGFWIAPLTNIKGGNNTECNSLATCLAEGTAEEISTWLYNEVDAVRNDNRAPLTLQLDSYWFAFSGNSYAGFVQFMDKMKALDDVFFVSVQDIIDWIHNSVPVSQYVTPDHRGRQSHCLGVNCHFKNDNGEDRHMMSCVPCLQASPWKGNPLGQL